MEKCLATASGAAGPCTALKSGSPRMTRTMRNPSAADAISVLRAVEVLRKIKIIKLMESEE